MVSADYPRYFYFSDFVSITHAYIKSIDVVLKHEANSLTITQQTALSRNLARNT